MYPGRHLSDFLQKNRAEAIAVSIFEYDEEKELALFRAAEREQGLVQGLCALINTLQKFCTDTDRIYIEVKKNAVYADLTRETFEKYLQDGEFFKSCILLPED